MTLFLPDTQPAPSAPKAPPELVARARKRMLWWSLPVVLVALAIAWKLFSLQITTDGAKSDLESGDYEGSIDRSSSLLFANVFEPWIPYFNRGTASAVYQDFTPATDDLGKALTLAPASERCMIRVNLALAWEQQGDSYRAAGFEEGAIRLYETSLAVIRDGAADGCQTDTSRDGEEQRGTLQMADERVQAKIDQQPPQPEPQPGEDDQDGDGSNGETGPSTGDKLQERGDQAERDKAQRDAEERGRNGSGGSVDKPW